MVRIYFIFEKKILPIRKKILINTLINTFNDFDFRFLMIIIRNVYSELFPPVVDAIF